MRAEPRGSSTTNRLILILLAAGINVIICITFLSYDVHRLYSNWWHHSQSQSLAVTRVGPRLFSPRYYTPSSCSSNQFLAALSRARISADGLSRAIDRVDYDYSNATLALPSSFQYSFELDQCSQPHVFTREEACDLVTSFGGLFMKGDSLVRHLHTALMMILVSWYYVKPSFRFVH